MIQFREWLIADDPDFMSEGKAFDRFKSMAKKAAALGLIAYHTSAAADPSAIKDAEHRKEQEIKLAAKTRKQKRRQEVSDILDAEQSEERLRKTA